jgi:predicted small lipoprotein YifL
MVGFILSLYACGQKGPLYLPDEGDNQQKTNKK